MKENIVRSNVAFVFLSLLFLTTPLQLKGAVLETIKVDLAAFSGLIVMQVEDSYIVDLDVSNGLKVSDLLTVIRPGEKIIHPITKKVLGNLDEVVAVLKVTLIKEGYAYTIPVKKKVEIGRGDIVRRFSNLTAAFLGDNTHFYKQLLATLPELNWQGQFLSNSDLPDTDLVFIVVGNQMDLLDSFGVTINSYDLSPGKGSAGPTKEAESITKFQPAQISNLSVTKEQHLNSTQNERRADKIEFGRFANLGELPDKVRMAAFLKGMDNILLATIDDKTLRVLRVAEDIRSVSSTAIDDRISKPLTVSWWQPENKGPLYLVVSAAYEIDNNSGKEVETRLAGGIFELRGNKLMRVAKNLPWFMGSYDRDGDSIPETLLGQEFEFDTVYGPVTALHLEGNSVRQSAVPFVLPQGFVVPGSKMADLNGDGNVEIVTVYNGILAVYSEGERLYQSSKEMGGSIATLTYDVNPGAVDLMHKTVTFAVPPSIADIDGNGMFEIFAASSESSIFGSSGIGSASRNSWVSVIKYRDGLYEKGRLPGGRENSLQGIWADKDRVLILESSAASIFFGEGKSNLLQFQFSDN